MKLSLLLRLARPAEWGKNIFVFAGLLFGHHFDETRLLGLGLLAFVSFCLASSAVYALNDCVDRDRDRQHPAKRHRPVASGQLTVGEAVLAAVVWALLAVICAAIVGMELILCVTVYLLVNVGYSLGLKHVVILDVFLIAVGFILRMLAGTYAIGIPPSHWIILCTLMLSLFLGFGKRYAEIRRVQPSTRAVLSDYSKPFLLFCLSVTTSCTILTYALYTISPRTLAIQGTENLIFTVPLVIFGLFRYLYLVQSRGYGENPSREIFRDAQIAVTLIFYLVLVIVLLQRPI